jgi:hypothetical protein
MAIDIRDAMQCVNIDAAHKRVERKADTFTNCNGPCQQGRRLCPVPEACQRIENDKDVLTPLACILVWVFGSIAAWAGIVALFLAIKG